MDLHIDSPVLESIDKSNENHKRIACELIVKTGRRKIGILGIAFKSGTDDLRNSPIIDVIEMLIQKGYELLVYDENVSDSTLLGANKEFIERNYLTYYLYCMTIIRR
ncbi:MAG: hypothetical protein MZW92_21655 [Comamonadaceae bacterium]|nr:hypothetical protein [Comamonadaceae bacterium]